MINYVRLNGLSEYVTSSIRTKEEHTSCLVMAPLALRFGPSGRNQHHEAFRATSTAKVASAAARTSALRDYGFIWSRIAR